MSACGREGRTNDRPCPIIPGNRRSYRPADAVRELGGEMTDKMPFILYSVPNHIMPPDWSGDWLIPYIRMSEPIGHQLPPMHPIEEASLKIHRTITPMGFFIFTCVSWPSELTREQAIDYLKNYLKNSE